MGVVVLGKINLDAFDASGRKKVRNIPIEDIKRSFEGRFSIRWTVPYPISEKEARKAQMSVGYHPAGYGFYFPETENGLSDNWKCSNSCD